MWFALTAALALITIGGSVFMHFETLDILERIVRRQRRLRHAFVMLVVMMLVLAHLGEVALFAAAFYAAVNILHLGSFSSAHSMMLLDYFYYAAETYSSLGYGDIYPLGSIRLLASITPLVGIMLLGWSSAFLFSLTAMHRTQWERSAPPVSRPKIN